MTNDPIADPLVDALAALPSVVPREAHDRRVRRRCYELLAGQRAQRQSRSVRLVDLMAAAAAAMYLAAVMTEAVRLLATAG